MPNGGTYEQAKQMEDEMLRELASLAPVLALTAAAFVAVILAMLVPRHRQGLVGAFVAAAHLVAAGLAVWVWLDRGFVAVMGGIVRVDGLSLALTGLIGVTGALCVALARPALADTDREAEFYAVLTFASLSAVLLGTAGDAALLGLSIGALGYKAAMVPFQFWTPDAYDGAPLPVAAYLSVLPKLAGLVAIARVLSLALPGDTAGWSTAIAVLAAATMTLGNVAALPQRNVVRLLAYSSIAQSGYLLMGVAALEGSDQGLPALVYYAIAYAAMNLAAFAVVLAVQRERGSVDLDAFLGLGRRHPWWTAALVVSFLSLLGLPPLAGFVGKLELFTAAIDADQAWLAAIAVVNTVVSLYYYLRVIAPAVLEPPAEPAPVSGAAGTIAVARPLGLVLAVTAAATVAFGVAAEPLLSLADKATMLGG